FDAEASTLKPLFRQDRFEIVGRIGAFSVVPDAHVLDDGRAPCLLHIRTSGEQRDDVIPSREHGTLEQDVAVGVEAGEVIVAFLRKEEQRIELALAEQTPCLRQALCVLLTAKMEVGLYHACLPQWRGPATASPSGRALARAALGREFPLSALSIAERVPSPTIAHVSSRPP